MQLPIQFTGLGHVNMYGLPDRRGIAIVDPGLPGRESWQAITASLKKAGFRIRDVHSVVVTHSHPDHFGGAGRLAKEAGAQVITHAEFSIPWLSKASPDVASLEPGDDLSIDDEPADPTSMHLPWRAPGDIVRPPQIPSRLPLPLARLAWRFGRRFIDAPTPTRRLTDGETISLADRDWVAVHTPGHTADHLCLFDPEERLFLAGDHVLPTITPHISGIGCGPDPLSQYLAALERVAQLDVACALPAHGHPFTDLADRTKQIADHHAARLDQLQQIYDAIGPATVEAFTHEMFRASQWGMMAESEVFAHLEHLRLDGKAHRQKVGGALVYDLRPADG